MLNNEEDNKNESGYKRKSENIKKRTGLHIKVSQQVAVLRMLMNNIGRGTVVHQYTGDWKGAHRWCVLLLEEGETLRDWM